MLYRVLGILKCGQLSLKSGGVKEQVRLGIAVKTCKAILVPAHSQGQVSRKLPLWIEVDPCCSREQTLSVGPGAPGTGQAFLLPPWKTSVMRSVGVGGGGHFVPVSSFPGIT